MYGKPEDIHEELGLTRVEYAQRLKAERLAAYRRRKGIPKEPPRRKLVNLFSPPPGKLVKRKDGTIRYVVSKQGIDVSLPLLWIQHGPLEGVKPWEGR